MKPIDNTNGSDGALPKLVSAAAGAIASTLAAKLMRRPRPAKRRRARQPLGAQRGQRAALVKGGGARG